MMESNSKPYRWERWARVLLVLGAAALAVSPLFPYWHLKLLAPQYPRGLALQGYPHRIEGDVHEIDILNHYIGMRKLEDAAQMERALALPGIAVLALAMLIAAACPSRWTALLVIPVVLFPAVFLLDLHLWLRDYGLHLDPHAPLNRSVKPFVPQVLGEGRIAQFRTYGSLGAGGYFCSAAALASLFFCWQKLRFRSSKPLGTPAAPTLPVKVARGAAVCVLLAAGSVRADTWIVQPNEGPRTIGEALARAAPGDTIVVRGGVHSGPITVTKPVRLVGEAGAIIDGGGQGTVLRLAAPGIHVRGLTIRNSGNLLANEDGGLLAAAPEAVIEDNRFEDVLFGIYLRQAPRSIVRGNRLRSQNLPVARRGDLIRLWYSDDVTIANNQTIGGRDIVLWFSRHLTIDGNHVREGRYGIHFMYCHDAVVTGNRLTGNSVGAFLMYSQNLRLERNWIESNRGASGYGIGLKDMDDSVVKENVIAGNRAGIFLENARGTFERNLLAGNDRGLLMFPSARGNRFVDNTFLENGEPVTIEGQSGLMTTNTWETNYWSDYRGYDADGDGRGDVAYRPARLFERLVDRQSALRLFAGSPAAEAIDFASRLFPIFEPQAKLVDLRPRMQPLPSPVAMASPAGIVKWLVLAGALLIWPVTILARLRLPARSRTITSSTAIAKAGVDDVAMTSAAIAVAGLTKRYGKVTAVDDLSFEVRSGETVALWGPNGAGKTTILKCLLGLLPFAGSAHVQGQRCGSRGKASRRLLGYVPQEVHLHADQTVHETVGFYARLRRVSLARGNELLAAWGLQDVQHRLVRHLSGGMKQKLALVLALLSDPPVLLLDEPTSNLDARSRQEFGQLLERLQEAGKTLLFCSHRPDEVWNLADRVLVLEGGRKVAEGPPEGVRDHLRKPALLCLTLAAERAVEAAELLDRVGFRVERRGTQLWVDAPAGRKLEPITLLDRAGIPLLDFDLEHERRGGAGQER